MFKLRAMAAIAVGLALTATACGSGSGTAGDTGSSYPNRPITFVLPFAPGGTADLAGRALAKYASSKLHQPVNVTNIDAASGITGTQQALNAKPDGYTLMIDSGATSSAQAAENANLPYKVSNRTYIGQMVTGLYYFIVNAKSPYKSLTDVMNYAKQRPDDFSWAAGASGSNLEFAQLALFQAAGIPVQKTKMVVFSGGQAPSVAAVASGEVLFGICSEDNAKSLEAAGKVRILALSGSTKSQLFPNIPTAASLGYQAAPGSVTNSWTGLSGPPGLPSAVVQKWDQLIQSAIKDPAFAAEMQKLELHPAYLDTTTFRKFVLEQYQLLIPQSKLTGK